MKDTIIDPEWDVDMSADNNLKTDDTQEYSKEESAANSSPEASDPFTQPEPGLTGNTKDYIGSLLSGNILSKAEIKRLYPYLLFVAFLTILYISNIYSLHSSYRKYDRLSREIKELKAESITIASERMNVTRQSRIVDEANARGLGLKESVIPPKVVK